MDLEDRLFILNMRGVGGDVKWALHRRAAESGCDLPLRELDARALQKLLAESAPAGARRGKGKRGIILPETDAIARQAHAFRTLGLKLVWRGDGDYPPKMLARMGDRAPFWALLGGDARRLDRPLCAMIGSRRIAPAYARAARELGRALADAGIPVVSGMAPGADTAAQSGALAGEAGCVAVPARGLLRVAAPLAGDNGRRLTLLGIGEPEARFHAGLAIERNRAMAALADALVLVSSGARGGSRYALNEALSRGIPVFCFTGGETPEANAALIKSGKAAPLPLDRPDRWVDEIQTACKDVRAAAKPSSDQLELLF